MSANNLIRIAVTGASGQLGSELQSLVSQYPEYVFYFLDRSQLPLNQLSDIKVVLDRFQPDYIVNTAAYTAVDLAETEVDLANMINHLAVAEMAKWANENDTRLIHISTDYVFDGSSFVPLNEEAQTAPLNVYGQTKLAGEQALFQINPNGIIIRTSWVYSSYGKNFVKTMLRLMNERESIGVVNDQIGSPTYALDLAEAIMVIVSSDSWEPGIFHYSNEGEVSWYDFAMAINRISEFNCKVEGIPSTAFPTPAKRPNYSLLDKSKIKSSYQIVVPNWETSLQKVLQVLNK